MYVEQVLSGVKQTFDFDSALIAERYLHKTESGRTRRNRFWLCTVRKYIGDLSVRWFNVREINIG